MTDIDRLPDDILETLAKYGFDRERFEAQQDRVASGTLNSDSNVVSGEIVAPESDSWADPLKKGSEDALAAQEAGEKAIASGHVGALILNGGMATRFGGVVKGTVQALPGRSFLALKIQNVVRESRSQGGRIPVYLMNSFSTDEPTRRHFEEHRNFGLGGEDFEFYTQGVSLRMEEDGSLFLNEEGRPSLYGPGHGDCPIWLRRSGCLERFIEGGGRYLMISNVDNLAARIDPLTLGRHILSKKKLTAEVAPKWPGDKGGSPAWVDGKLWVIEGFRFPENFNQDSIPVFNTNTFTVHADQLDRSFELTDCYVAKEVDGRTAVQIETLVGELTRFLPTHYMKVKRTGKTSRFFPIKTPQDLEDGREDLELICG